MVTLLGILISVKQLLRKASFPTILTVSGIITEFIPILGSCLALSLSLKLSLESPFISNSLQKALSAISFIFSPDSFVLGKLKSLLF